MPASFIVVPQWQGSSSSRAMRLVDGALAIRGDLPATATTTVDVPLEAGDELTTGIARYGSIQITHERVRAAVAQASAAGASWLLTIGGDCSVELGAIGHVLEKANATAIKQSGAIEPNPIAVVWFDAHPDANTPASSPSGAFAGMVVRALTGEGMPGLLPSVPLDPARIVFVGVRDVDAGEEDFIAEHSIAMISAADLAESQSLIVAIAATGATDVYVHIDLDVLDPSEFTAHDSPVPFGLSTTTLLESIRALRKNFTLVGAGITQFAPASPEAAADDLPTILRIVGALAS
ncbi:MAG: arginase family protein [Microbacteriaceae bacterium]